MHFLAEPIVRSILNRHKQHKMQKLGSTVRWTRKTSERDSSYVAACLLHGVILISRISARCSDGGGFGKKEGEPESNQARSGGLLWGTVARSSSLLPDFVN